MIVNLYNVSVDYLCAKHIDASGIIALEKDKIIFYRVFWKRKISEKCWNKVTPLISDTQLIFTSFKY